jgi:hypothetical protein
MAAAGLNPAGARFFDGPGDGPSHVPSGPEFTGRARNHLPVAALQMPAPSAAAAEPKEFR